MPPPFPPLHQGLVAKKGVELNEASAVNAVAITGLAEDYMNYVMKTSQLGTGSRLTVGV